MQLTVVVHSLASIPRPLTGHWHSTQSVVEVSIADITIIIPLYT